MKVIGLEGVRRSYQDGVDVLKGVDLSLARGEVVGLVGRNGAGKTTLIKVLMGLLRPRGGTVRVFDLDPWTEPVAVKLRIGYVSEEQTLPEYLPVSEVLGLHQELFPTWDASLAEEFLDRFRLLPGARMSALSKGQARQVMFLCAIAHRPELLVLDEPAGGLDPVARRDFLEAAITRLNRDGTTILFSSHHMTDVERLAGRIVFLHEGRKLLDRDLDALREGHSLVVLPAETPLEEARRLPGCVATRRRTDGVHVVLEGDRGDGRALSLEDLFIELVEGQPC